MHKFYRGAPSEIKLADGQEQSDTIEVQLFRVGSFYDDRYGTVQITEKHLSEMLSNFNNRTRGIDIALDFSHENDKKAAGWITSLRLGEDKQSLWGTVKLTAAGQQSVSTKEFRYISPEFDLAYKDNEERKLRGPTLLGAGLTNRPVIKAMAPTVALKEITPEEQAQMKTFEEVQAELKKATDTIADQTKKFEELSKKFDDVVAAAAPAAPAEPKAGEPTNLEDALKEISALKAKIAELEGKEKAASEKVAAAEKNAAFTKMLSEGKAVEAQRDAFIKGDMISFAEKATAVKFGAQGSGKTPSGEGKSADDEVEELATAMVSEKKISFREATSRVLRENPVLAKKYHEAHN